MEITLYTQYMKAAELALLAFVVSSGDAHIAAYDALAALVGEDKAKEMTDKVFGLYEELSNS